MLSRYYSKSIILHFLSDVTSGKAEELMGSKAEKVNMLITLWELDVDERHFISSFSASSLH